MLKIPEDRWPQTPLGWDAPDAISEWIEYLIGEAERQLGGSSRGPDRMEAVVEAVVRSVELPDVAASVHHGGSLVGRRGIAKMVSQMVYSTIARRLPPNLRTTPPPR